MGLSFFVFFPYSILIFIFLTDKLKKAESFKLIWQKAEHFKTKGKKPNLCCARGQRSDTVKIQ